MSKFIILSFVLIKFISNAEDNVKYRIRIMYVYVLLIHQFMLKFNYAIDYSSSSL